VAQWEGSEFKPQYQKKEKETRITGIITAFH
jgi:hypothetical protein